MTPYEQILSLLHSIEASIKQETAEVSKLNATLQEFLDIVKPKE